MTVKNYRTVCLMVAATMTLASCVSTSGTKTTAQVRCSNPSAYGFKGENRNHINTAHGTFVYDAEASSSGQNAEAMHLYSRFFTPHRWIHPDAEIYSSGDGSKVISYTVTRGMYRKTPATNAMSGVLSAVGLHGAPMRDIGGGKINLDTMEHNLNRNVPINGPYKAGNDVFYFDLLDGKTQRYYLWAIHQHPAQVEPQIYAYVSPVLTSPPRNANGLAAQAISSYACLWY